MGFLGFLGGRRMNKFAAVAKRPASERKHRRGFDKEESRR